MIRLGIGSYTYAWAVGVPGYGWEDDDAVQEDPAALAAQRITSPHELIERATAFGVRVVQIADNLPLERLSSGELDALAAHTGRQGITLEVGTRGSQPDHLLRMLAIAQTLGASIVRAVVDLGDDEPTPDEAIARMRAVMPAYRAAGVTLAIENHDRFPVAVLAGMIAAVESPHVGICLDTVNSFGSLEGPDVVIETLAPYVVNLHIKDFSIQRLDHKMGFAITGTPAGRGRLDVPRLLERLSGDGRSFSAILEHWPAYERSTRATAAKEAVWVAESITYLRSVILD